MNRLFGFVVAAVLLFSGCATYEAVRDQGFSAAGGGVEKDWNNTKNNATLAKCALVWGKGLNIHKCEAITQLDGFVFTENPNPFQCTSLPDRVECKRRALSGKDSFDIRIYYRDGTKTK